MAAIAPAAKCGPVMAPRKWLLGYFVMGRVADERRLGETRKNGEDTQKIGTRRITTQKGGQSTK